MSSGTPWFLIELLIQVGDVLSIRLKTFLSICKFRLERAINCLQLVELNLLQLELFLSLNLLLFKLICNVHLLRYAILLILHSLLDVLHLALLQLELLLELLVLSLLLVDD